MSAVPDRSNAAEAAEGGAPMDARKAQTVVGPPSCEDHRAHRVGCLACAAEVCAANDDDIDDFLGRMEHIGWERPDGW